MQAAFPRLKLQLTKLLVALIRLDGTFVFSAFYVIALFMSRLFTPAFNGLVTTCINGAGLSV